MKKEDINKLVNNETTPFNLILEKDKEIERLNNIINGLDNTIENLDEVIEQKDNILNKAKEKAIDLEKKYGYILGDLIYLLMQGSDKE